MAKRRYKKKAANKHMRKVLLYEVCDDLDAAMKMLNNHLRYKRILRYHFKKYLPESMAGTVYSWFHPKKPGSPVGPSKLKSSISLRSYIMVCKTLGFDWRPTLIRKEVTLLDKDNTEETHRGETVLKEITLSGRIYRLVE